MKLLIIEDDEKTAAYLRKGLTETGSVVDVARNGVDGQHLAHTGDYEAIVLDLMLPGRDGLAVLGSIRRQKATPMLS